MLESWSEWQDLNLRPPLPARGALPGCATPRLIAHVADRAAAHRLAEFDASADRLAMAFWPGPLTLVLKKRATCPVAELAAAGLDTLAVRVPSHPVAREILMAFGRPVAAPSA